MSKRHFSWDKDHIIELFQRNKPQLIQMAARIVGCNCLAEDIVQNTMVKIWERHFDEEVQSPTAYLFRMVRNLSIDCARRRIRERNIGNLDEEGMNLPALCPCPETQMVRCQALRMVMKALEELPDRTRRAFEMHRIDGVSQREIALQMPCLANLGEFHVP